MSGLSPDVIACAHTLEKGDPDRFRCVMAAPVDARARLFPLYAFNVEVARAPWVTQEAMIAEMRLQWWRDALEEMAEARPVRKHQATTPLAALLTPDQARRLDESVAARRWDVYREPFEDQAHWDAYIDHTAGHLMWTACEVLGAAPEVEPQVRDLAFAAGTAAFLRAIPALVEGGRIPLLDGTPDGLVALARRARARAVRPAVTRSVRPALWPAIGAGTTLDQVIADPDAVADGRLDPGITPWRLSRTALFGRVVL